MAAPIDEDKGPGCCGVLLLAALLMLAWNILAPRRLEIGYMQALAVIGLFAILGIAQRLFRLSGPRL